MGGSVGKALGTEGGFLDKNSGKIGGYVAGGPTGALIGHFGMDKPRMDAERAAIEAGQPPPPPDPRPTAPGFNPLLGEGGKYQTPYELGWGNEIKADERGINELRNIGLAQGPSSWATNALAKQGLEEAGQRNALSQQGASALAQGRSSLASKAGLSQGASERMARGLGRDQMLAGQNIGFQGAQNRYGIGMQDELMRRNVLQSLPGQDLQFANLAMQNRQGQLGAQQGLADRAEKQKAAQDAYNMDKYKEDTKLWAGRQAAQALRDEHKGGSSWLENIFG